MVSLEIGLWVAWSNAEQSEDDQWIGDCEGARGGSAGESSKQ